MKVALQLPIILELRSMQDLNAKIHSVKRTILILNCFFYAQIIGIVTLLIWFDLVATKYFLIYDILNKLYTAVILVLAMRIIKVTMHKLNSPEFFAREKLMSLHSFLFLSYIVAYTIANLNAMATIHYRTNHEWLLGCRYLIAADFFYLITKLINIAILILTTYMTG